MDSTQNSKLLLHEQEKHTSPYHAHYPTSSVTLFKQNPRNHFSKHNPMFSSMKLINELKSAARPNCDDSFVPSSTELGSSWYSDVQGEHCNYVDDGSESDSCSRVDGDEEYSDDDDGNEEARSLEYDELLVLLNDGKTKRKIEELAAMVGVDTTEPAVVLSEVVRVLKHLMNRINHNTATASE